MHAPAPTRHSAASAPPPTSRPARRPLACSKHSFYKAGQHAALLPATVTHPQNGHAYCSVMTHCDGSKHLAPRLLSAKEQLFQAGSGQALTAGVGGGWAAGRDAWCSWLAGSHCTQGIQENPEAAHAGTWGACTADDRLRAPGDGWDGLRRNSRQNSAKNGGSSWCPAPTMVHGRTPQALRLFLGNMCT